MTARKISSIVTKDDINWHYEQEGSGPDIILIPDGFGDCELYSRPLSIIASHGFRVTTFDMPGMSRSVPASRETYQQVTAQKLAGYIVNLMDSLAIRTATFFGCSSGACTVLALVVDYPDRVRNALPHEVPTKVAEPLKELAKMDDESLIKTFRSTLPFLAGDMDSWNNIEASVLARIDKNYLIWARGYPLTCPLSTPVNEFEKLRQRPIDWTVGAMTRTQTYLNNIVTAVKIGAGITTIPGYHFPYVSHPIEFAEYIIATTQRYI